MFASGVKCSTSILKCLQAESGFNYLLYKIANVSLKLVAIDASRFGLSILCCDTKRNVPDAPPCSYHRGGGSSVASLCSDARSLLLVINLI